MNLEPLSDRELGMNQQAATIAASVLSQPVEAATRCEQTTTTMVQFYRAAGPDVWSRSVPNGTGLPKSFILAVTKSHVHALEDKRHGDNLIAGRVLKSWDRAGFKARCLPAWNGPMGAPTPDDRQVLILYLPIDGDSGPFRQEMARRIAAAGRPYPGKPHNFVVARDAPSQRVIDALVTAGGAVPEAVPAAAVAPPAVTPPRPSAAQRLQELETLRATGVISGAEYTRQREQIISEL
jgi:hypothetical protein